MVFNSLAFLAFLGIVLLLYYRLGHRGQNWMLLVASYVFYGWWDYRFLALLLFTSLFDYACALWISRQNDRSKRRWLLASSMAVNLGVLGVFKYFNFFAHSLEQSMALLGITLSFPTLHVILPVGISFYTFLSMSYTIDVYRRELSATRRVGDFLLYVAFFPHLVAGPIVRASVLLPQCQRARTIVPAEVANGLWLMLLGYLKKVVIADRLAQVVDWGFSAQGPPVGDANSWLVLYAFAFQIYGDFSGYTDIARGVSKLMGFELVENFRAPYLVTNPAAFWRHWHISLSTWLRDYLYIPLGGNRGGRWKTYRNLMATMLLGGLWHGAGAAYVLWGLYHGALLACQRAWQDFVAWRFQARPNAGPAEKRVDLSPVSPRAVAKSRSSDCAGPPPEERPAGMAPSDASMALTARKRADQTAVRNGAPGRSGGEGGQGLAGFWLGHCIQIALVLVFFHITCVGWLLFRAGSLPRSVDQPGFVLRYLAVLPVWPRAIHPMVQGVFVLGAASLFFQWKFQSMNRFSLWPPPWQTLGVVAAAIAIAALGVFEGAQFIYFQF